MNEPADPELWRTFLKEWYAVYREVCRLEMNDPHLAGCPSFKPITWETFEARYETLLFTPEEFRGKMCGVCVSASRYGIRVPHSRFGQWNEQRTIAAENDKC